MFHYSCYSYAKEKAVEFRALAVQSDRNEVVQEPADPMQIRFTKVSVEDSD